MAAAPQPVASYLEGPPAAHVGGFGSDTCHACHFENELDAPGGSLALRGVPVAFAPSATYRITRAVPVVFHAAANAANDDASEFGDFIYTASATTRPAGP
ncbi:MAG: hypothetical protein J4F37_04945 [Acidobacteria bacterium]|nr:hypothetical protein [Acidobacteriota bacterium]